MQILSHEEIKNQFQILNSCKKGSSFLNIGGEVSIIILGNVLLQFSASALFTETEKSLVGILILYWC